MTFDMNNKQLYTKAIKPIKNLSIKETPLDSKGNIDFSKINILEDELYHHGTEGMHWHIRRYQNEDGTWTEEGLQRRRDQYSESKPSGKQLVKAGAKSTASGVGDAFRVGNRAVRGATKTALRGNVVFARNALSGIKSGIKSVMDGGDAKEGLNIAKKGIKTGASQAAAAKKQVAKESAESVKEAAKSSVEKVSVGAIQTAAGTAKIVKGEKVVEKEKNTKIKNISQEELGQLSNQIADAQLRGDGKKIKESVRRHT